MSQESDPTRIYITQGEASQEGWNELYERAIEIGTTILSVTELRTATVVSSEATEPQREAEHVPEGPVLNEPDFLAFASRRPQSANNASSAGTTAYLRLLRTAEQQADGRLDELKLPPLIMGIPMKKVRMKDYVTDSVLLRNIEARSLLNFAEAVQLQAATLTNQRKGSFYNMLGRNVGPGIVAFWHEIAQDALKQEKTEE